MNDVLISLFASSGFDKAAQGLAGAGRGLADRLGGRPRAVLLANDTYSQEITPRLAHRLGGSAVGDGVEVRAEGGAPGVVRVVRQVYGGKAQAVIELRRAPAVVWLRARSFAPAPARAEAGEVTRAALDLRAEARTRVVERVREEQGEARLEDARV